MKHNVTTQVELVNIPDVTTEGEEMQRADPLILCGQLGQSKSEDHESIDLIPRTAIKCKRSRSQSCSAIFQECSNIMTCAYYIKCLLK